MVESHASASPGAVFGAILIAGLVLLDAGCLVLLAGTPITLLSFAWGFLLLASVPTVAFIAYWTSSLTAANYRVTHDFLIIEWGRIRRTIPLQRIQKLLSGEALLGVRRFRGVRWPGCFIGRGEMEVAGGTSDRPSYPTLYFSTRQISKQMLVITDNLAYAISPVDLQNFKDCILALKTTGAENNAAVEETVEPGFLGWQFWRDKTAQMVWGTAVLLNIALFAYLCWLYGRLPVQVPLHFNQAGLVDRFASPGNLFVLPLAGLLTWICNGLIGWIYYESRKEKPIAFLLWGGAILVQLASWTALSNLLK